MKDKTFNYEIFSDEANIPETAFYSSTLSNSVLAGKKFFRIVKESLDGPEFYYLGIYSGNDLIALISVMEVTIKIGPLQVRQAICGNPVISSDSGIFTLRGMDREKIIPGILISLNHAMAARKVSLTVEIWRGLMALGLQSALS